MPIPEPTTAPMSTFQGSAVWDICRRKECRFDIENDESIVFTVVEISIEWPQSSGSLPVLDEVKQNKDKIWDGTSTVQPTVITSWDGNVSIRELEGGEVKEFKLKFDDDVNEGEALYTVMVTLENSQTGARVTIPVE
jgi:hypothetical protein